MKLTNIGNGSTIPSNNTMVEEEEIKVIKEIEETEEIEEERDNNVNIDESSLNKQLYC